MVLQLEVVFEHGILRPLEPLSLPEQHRVFLTITDAPLAKVDSGRREEQEWLLAHGADYRGQWLALQNDKLISHGQNARDVRDEARRKGVPQPLLVHVTEDFDKPSAGWL
jgi:predicted DNA-binding antitoxin AbrB/MazE fold protein